MADPLPADVRSSLLRFFITVLWVVMPVMVLCNIAYFAVSVSLLATQKLDKSITALVGSGLSAVSFSGLVLFCQKIVAIIRNL